jgi:hypothetical protein
MSILRKIIDKISTRETNIEFDFYIEEEIKVQEGESHTAQALPSSTELPSSPNLTGSMSFPSLISKVPILNFKETTQIQVETTDPTDGEIISLPGLEINNNVNNSTPNLLSTPARESTLTPVTIEIPRRISYKSLIEMIHRDNIMKLQEIKRLNEKIHLTNKMMFVVSIGLMLAILVK